MLPKTIIVSFGLLILIAFLYKERQGKKNENLFVCFFAALFKHAVLYKLKRFHPEGHALTKGYHFFLLIVYNNWRTCMCHW